MFNSIESYNMFDVVDLHALDTSKSHSEGDYTYGRYYYRDDNGNGNSWIERYYCSYDFFLCGSCGQHDGKCDCKQDRNLLNEKEVLKKITSAIQCNTKVVAYRPSGFQLNLSRFD